MPGNQSTESPVTAGPGAKCCLGVTYFNRTLERNGTAPRCMGMAQFKQGEQDNDDVRMLNEATGDFQYYCIGYSSHPTDAKPSGQGKPTQMPFCEGVEIAITEERVQAATAAESTAAAPLVRDRSPPAVDAGASSAPLPPAAAAEPSNEDRSLQARFRKQLLRNTGSLVSALTGEKFPPLPVQLRKYDTVAEARDALSETASVNLLKMRAMAEFIRTRTLDAVKPIWGRFGSEEETE